VDVLELTGIPSAGTTWLIYEVPGLAVDVAIANSPTGADFGQTSTWNVRIYGRP
jgi:hypothetical protein